MTAAVAACAGRMERDALHPVHLAPNASGDWSTLMRWDAAGKGGVQCARQDGDAGEVGGRRRAWWVGKAERSGRGRAIRAKMAVAIAGHKDDVGGGTKKGCLTLPGPSYSRSSWREKLKGAPWRGLTSLTRYMSGEGKTRTTPLSGPGLPIRSVIDDVLISRVERVNRAAVSFAPEELAHYCMRYHALFHNSIFQICAVKEQNYIPKRPQDSFKFKCVDETRVERMIQAHSNWRRLMWQEGLDNAINCSLNQKQICCNEHMAEPESKGGSKFHIIWLFLKLCAVMGTTAERRSPND
ncbi:hypothetical protein B0H16DRAFT_1477703 [Mycena metata]|uniref:Uncharacterized protein n=1 Tax=Mycena metata TaxID=1033252 RepID=A0AAD7H8F2_9AGAR|nr:hypothetical protein B0H16DRAFT_1477703 [Mycena metata]